MPALYRLFYDRILRVLLLAGLLWFLLRLVDNFDRRVLARVLPAGASARHTTLTLGRRILKIAAFVFVVLLGLASFGVNLTATLAGLGIGGLALAFAAQKTLANLFGGIAVLTENVIRVGDTCRIGGQLGEVEDVTLWSTRLRTSERTVLSIPNGMVMESPIENLSRRDKFWFHPVVGLVYETTATSCAAFWRASAVCSRPIRAWIQPTRASGSCGWENPRSTWRFPLTCAAQRSRNFWRPRKSFS